MRVLLVPTPPDAIGATLSGVDKYLYELSRAMREEVEYVFLAPESGSSTRNAADAIQNAESCGRATAAVPSARAAKPRRLLPSTVALILGYVRETRSLARRMKPFRGSADLVHVVAAGCEPHNIAARLAGFPRVLSTVQALPGLDPPAQHRVRRMVERLSFRSPDLHIVVSDATREGWSRRLNRPLRNTVTIFNGMSPPDYTGFDRAAYRRQFCEDPDTVIFGICARLHRMKGHKFLLDAFARLLREQRTGARRPMLLIAGKGPEEADIRSRIQSLGIERNVKLVGHRSDPCFFAAALDVNVLPSVEMETIGYQNIEAMFAGVPSVVSDFGGMKEIVGPSGGGRVVPAGDARALSEAMRYYLDHPEARAADGASARTFAHQRLTARAMADATLDVYRRMLSSR